MRGSSPRSFLRSRLFPAFVVLGCCALFAAAQDQAGPAHPAQDQTKPAAVAQATKSPDVSKEALAWDKLVTRYRFEPDGTGTREITAVVRVLADAGVKQMAVLTFTYTSSNQQVDIGYVRVKKPDGTVVTTPDYNTQDLPADVTREAPMYSDIHQKHVAVKGLGVGDTLEYKVTFHTLKPEVPGQFWAEYNFEKNVIILDEELDVDLPGDKAATVASADVQPTVTTANGRKLYHWSSSNLSRPDPDAPPKSTKHVKPSVQLTTFTSWEQIGTWYASLQQPSLAVTPAIQAKVADLTKGLTTDDDKIRAIFNDVALHIHYIGLEFGIGRYQPHPADDVLSNEYGDCKDKHTLLATMLKAAGIQAWPVLISSNRELDPATPSPAQFDHVITAVPLGGKLVWMDSTAEIAPVGVLFGTLRDKQALAVPTDKSPYLERTPVDLPYPQSTRFEANGALSSEGVFTGRLSQTYRGDAELIMRSAFREVPQSQWTTFLQRVSNYGGFAGEVKNPDVSPIEQTAQPLHFSYDYKREKFGEWDDHRIMPPMPPVGWELGPGVIEKKPADEVEIGSPGELVYASSVQLPSGWSMFPPQGTNLSEDWAEYHSSYSFKSGTFTAERRLITKKNKIPLDQWDKYLAFRRAIYDDEIRMSTLVNPHSPLGNEAAIPVAGFTAIREQLVAAVQPSRDAVAILEANPAPNADELAKAVQLSRKAVEDIESTTSKLTANDPNSLYWGQALAYAWCARGWAAFEVHDLSTAASYLRAAWRLGQDRLSGFQLARLLDAQGKKTEAAHQYELANATHVQNPLGGFLATGYDLDDRLAAGYKATTGKDLKVTALNHGQYEGSLRAELDKETEVHQLTHTSKLTGAGLYAVAFESGKPAKATMLHGDKGFETMTASLQSHVFPAALPEGSKAKLLREVRVVCTPWAGCDAYILLPTSIEMPSINLRAIQAQGAAKGTKMVQIQVQQ
jgi:hypothetical protein